MLKPKGLLIDITQCVGCGACQAACKEANGQPATEESTLSPTAYTALTDHDGTYVRQMCRHCLEPTCQSVCPVGAFEKQAAGPVLYDESKCIGCRYCMQACPFQVPRYEWTKLAPKVTKCRMCAERVAEGRPTACAEACPAGATLFGDRDDMLKEAWNRINAEPDKYVHKVYGEHEVGGTSVLFITATPFEQLGFNTKLEMGPLPVLTHNALEKIPGVVGVGATLLYGIYWITSRRDEVPKLEEKLAEMERRDKTGGRPSQPGGREE